ncbi:MAG TPA: hypothetical protein VLT47_09315 [Anaeromyxobacteraceae bacterium]|nr:hypothetical protein [Anaeromyxobacteraceae bacterium]
MLTAALALALLAVANPIAVPPWPLSPDGERVAVFDGARLEADGATVEREAGAIWRVLPARGRERVELRAAGSSVQVPVAPPPGRILVSCEPAAPVKGKDRTARLRVEARSAGGAPIALESAPHVVVSSGRLGPLAPAGAPGSFEATWELPDSPQPEVLGVVAVAPRCPLCATPLAAGAARVPVAAAIDLPGRSEPGVETRVEIGGRVWGPVRADGEGRFRVAAVVPPGARWALATSLNALGNERRTRLDLHLAEAPGFVCALWPERVPADGLTEAGLLCLAWTAAGGSADPAPLRAVAGRGAIAGARVDGELFSARYRPPAGGAGADRVSISWGAGPPKELTIGLAPGAPASITWQPEGEPAVPGQTLAVGARALDARGDPLGDASTADGAVSGGRLRVRPDLGEGRQPLTLTWALPPGGPVARLSLHRVGSEWVAVARDVDARPVAGVPLRFGGGEQGATDARGEVRRAARGSVETVQGPSGLQAIAWAAAPTPIPALSVSRTVSLALRPPGSVDVVATLDRGWIRWKVVSPGGEVLPARKVSVESDSVRVGPVEPQGDGGQCAVRGGKGAVAVVDLESGAAAVLEVP